MGTFFLKYRDVLPVLEVTLLRPDGTAFDLTGASSVTLHIKPADGSVVSRAMTIYDITGGVVRYAWQLADWTLPGLIGSTTAPLLARPFEQRMEYEAQGPGWRLTFPNDGYDTLRIVTDIGQA